MIEFDWYNTKEDSTNWMIVSLGLICVTLAMMIDDDACVSSLFACLLGASRALHSSLSVPTRELIQLVSPNGQSCVAPIEEDSFGTLSVAPSILLMSIAVRSSLAPDELDESGRPCEA